MHLEELPLLIFIFKQTNPEISRSNFYRGLTASSSLLSSSASISSEDELIEEDDCLEKLWSTWPKEAGRLSLTEVCFFRPNLDHKEEISGLIIKV